MSYGTRIVTAIVVSTIALAATSNALAGHSGHSRHSSSEVHIGVKLGHNDHRGHGFHRRHGGHGSHRDGYYRGDCRKVSKHGYYHGREARIGGTLCYDRYGEPHIVRGSRYVIRYY